MIVRRADGFSEVVPEWQGKTVVVMATGPSLTREVVTKVAAAKVFGGARVIAINDAYLMAPWADVLYFADPRWWDWQRDPERYRRAAGEEWWSWHRNSRALLDAFPGEIVTVQSNEQVKDSRVHVLKLLGPEGFSTDRGAVYCGRNSGYQALQLAAHTGGARIALVGYDMRKDGKPHFFGEHPVRGDQNIMREFAKVFRFAEKPLAGRVLNCTPGSVLESFPIRALEEALA